MAEDRTKIDHLIANPQLLLQKKPFFRELQINARYNPQNVDLNQTIQADTPRVKKMVISQDEYLQELNPYCHKVLFDDNVPSITMKLSKEQGGGWATIEYKKMAISFQENIKNKQVLHLCGNPLNFTLMETNPTTKQSEDFITFKQYWDLRNQDGMKTKMVDAQKSVGDAGLLYYFDRKGEIKSRLLSYMDGYVLCPHNDDNGDRLLESVYYKKDDIEYIDSYDDRYMYRHMNDGSGADENGWKLIFKNEHGFSEIPLITKRGKVAWDDAQSSIEAYEVLYNIFLVIQKRHGWGILYIKGRFDNDGRKIAGSVILNDRSDDANSDAKFLTPPTPEGTIETLNLLEETIQKGSKTTFILPKDIKMSGDISGIAIMLTQSLDIENALQGVIEWQNVADKMCRLFKEGLAKELVKKDIQPTAITDFNNIKINAKFKVWRPQSDTDFAQMLVTLKSNGLLSEESGIELSPVSSPDEKARRQKEKDLEKNLEIEKETIINNSNSTNNIKEEENV